MTSEFWNSRYKENVNVYGDIPNVFFRDQLLKMPAGRLLLPAEGEGRNALYAASQGWHVTAFDYSEAAMIKALATASLRGLPLEYSLQDINSVMLSRTEYDAIGLVYVHMEPLLRFKFHRQCIDALKPGGVLILEAFSKEQLKNSSGGPANIELLYSIDDLLRDFSGLQIETGLEESIILDEGPFHKGTANVVRVVAKKM